MRFHHTLACAALCTLGAASVSADDIPFAPKAEHVVLIVWDGMRPDFVRPDTTPTLHAMAESGTFFANNHCVYVTSTEVNGAAISTGCYPHRTNIIANSEYLPEVNLIKPSPTEGTATIRIADGLRDGHYIQVPTLAELVQLSGSRTAIAGTKGVALIHDRTHDRAGSHGSTILFAGKCYPESNLPPLIAAIGKFPDLPAYEDLVPNTAQNAWTAKALTEFLWRDGVPKFSTLWLGDPDFSQHLTRPGSDTALAALKNCDDNLAIVLAALEAKGVRGKTDIFLVSDHGFSTVERVVDVPALAKKAGFNVVRAYKQTPRPGEVLYVPLGGSSQFYVPGHDAVLVKKLVAFLQASDFSGPIFTREPAPGTFPLSAGRLESPDSPDILFSYRWRDGTNDNGTPGLLIGEGRKAGFGTHASLSPYDFHNTLIAAGPDIRASFRDTLPTANVDVAPTIARILGLEAWQNMEGRVLTEALPDGENFRPQIKHDLLEESTPGGENPWHQYLRFTVLDDYRYLDQGGLGVAPQPLAPAP